MKKTLRAGFLLPLTVFGFAAVGVQYANTIFSTSTRWIFLLLLIAAIAIRGHLWNAFRLKISPVLILYLGWGMLTIFWSEIPILSALKSAAYILSVTAFLGGGIYWVRNCGSRPPIFYLLPILLLALFAGLFGSNQAVSNGGEEIYEGLSGNPNDLGMLVAVSFPAVLYCAYRLFNRRSTRLARWGIVGLLVLLCFLLFRSGSRSATLMTFMIISLFALATFSRRIVPIIVICVFIIAGSAVLFSSATGSIYARATQFIIKSDADDGILFSRIGVWQADYDAARKGGTTGVGFGISAGETGFVLGLTAEDYGRMKANSQLSVAEETGLIGFALYLVMNVQIIWILSARLLTMTDRDRKIQLALALGVIVGLQVMSIFEAWWTSPGSPEAAVFWSTVGVAFGMAPDPVKRIRRRAWLRAPITNLTDAHGVAA